MNIQAIEQEVLHLPIEDRARLAEKLLSSLDALSEQEIEKLWLVEAQVGPLKSTMELFSLFLPRK